MLSGIVLLVWQALILEGLGFEYSVSVIKYSSPMTRTFVAIRL